MTPLHVLVLTPAGDLESLPVSGGDVDQIIASAIHGRRVKPHRLSGGVDLWRNLEAVLEPYPVLNTAAMWLIQQLRSPVEVPVIWGPAVIASRTEFGAAPLSLAAVTLLRNALAEEPVVRH